MKSASLATIDEPATRTSKARDASPTKQCRDGSGDAEFFASYEWCLNPLLRISGLQARLRTVWHDAQTTESAWQRGEHEINVYLLLCALDCTAADYLCFLPLRLEVVARRFRRWPRLLALSRAIANLPTILIHMYDARRIRAWRASTRLCLDACCRILVNPGARRQEDLGWLGRELPSVWQAQLPPRCGAWRTRVPEAFRCQDLTHHDVIAMAERLRVSLAVATRHVFVLGPRTAGNYFAPLVHAHLERSGVASHGWISLRPKDGITREERRKLRAVCESQGLIVIIDDHPNTGNTFALLVNALGQLGVSRSRIIVVSPDHPAQLDWKPLVSPAQTVSLSPSEFHKSKLLGDDEQLLSLARGLLRARGLEVARLCTSDMVDRINANLAAQYGASFEVRLKRVFEVEVLDKAGTSRRMMILAKSTGWGYLAYHAFFAAGRLADFVPELIGVREGLMFVEWVASAGGTNAEPDPSDIAHRVPAYVAARARCLPLEEAPYGGTGGHRVTGRNAIVAELKFPYGRFLSRVVGRKILNEWARLAPPRPILTDGRMERANWVNGAQGLRKVNFEHHNFGGIEQDVVDPAYDLADAIFELNLDAEAEDRMVTQFVRETGDQALRDRVLPYKLHAGLLAMVRAGYELARPFSPTQLEAANRRFLKGRDFLTYHFGRHMARRIPIVTNPAWTDKLFFLDLDGVLDIQALGFFPHTTPNGLRALWLLQAHGYSVIPNSGRSVDHVRHYCETYGLPGGVAELGTVFFDRVTGSEERLLNADVADELQRCREKMEQLPGVLVDPSYRTIVHAYRYRGGRWIGLTAEDIARAQVGGLGQVEVVMMPEDTYVVPKVVNKGTAVSIVRKRAASLAFVAAMGDGKTDVAMLREADIAFSPANACQEIRAFAGARGGARITAHSTQMGLLEAVFQLLRDHDGVRDPASLIGRADPVRAATHILDVIMDDLDRPLLHQWLRVITRRMWPYVA